MDSLISNAFADTAGASSVAAQQGGGSSLILMLVLFVVFMYFMVWRPQNKRVKEQQNLINSVAKDDEIMTAGGLLGRVAKVTDQYIVLTVANNTDLVVQKSAVVSVLPKGTIKAIA